MFPVKVRMCTVVGRANGSLGIARSANAGSRVHARRSASRCRAPRDRPRRRPRRPPGSPASRRRPRSGGCGPPRGRPTPPVSAIRCARRPGAVPRPVPPWRPWAYPDGDGPIRPESASKRDLSRARPSPRRTRTPARPRGRSKEAGEVSDRRSGRFRGPARRGRCPGRRSGCRRPRGRCAGRGRPAPSRPPGRSR